MNIKVLQRWAGPLVSIGLLYLVGAILADHLPGNARIVSFPVLYLSIMFLLIGLIFQYMLWHVLVIAVTGTAELRETFCAHALMVWSKYVPGKIWSVVGRAGYLARLRGESLALLIVASSSAQVAMLATGIACGMSLLLLNSENLFPSGIVIQVIIPSIIAGAAVLMYGFLYRRLGCWKRSVRVFVAAMLIATCAWGAWGIGFSCMVRSMGLGGLWLRDIGIFSSAASAGILAVIAPGGLGVREGALSGLLVTYGMGLGSAALVALVARLWFGFGELLLFASGFLLCPVKRD